MHVSNHIGIYDKTLPPSGNHFTTRLVKHCKTNSAALAQYRNT